MPLHVLLFGGFIGVFARFFGEKRWGKSFVPLTFVVSAAASVFMNIKHDTHGKSATLCLAI